MLNTEGLEEEAEAMSFRPVPSWLGTFHFKTFGNVYGRHQGQLHPLLRAQALRMSALVPEIDFNAVFLQRYRVGEYVAPHRDPANNLLCTLIGVFGRFEGATTIIGSTQFVLKTGDVCMLPCTIDGVRGPTHQVTPVTAGTRWSLILNCIRN